MYHVIYQDIFFVFSTRRTSTWPDHRTEKARDRDSSFHKKTAILSVFQENYNSLKSESTLLIFLQKVDVSFQKWTFLKMSKTEKSAGEFCKKSSSLVFPQKVKIIILV
jgi:hypothetical protein